MKGRLPFPAFYEHAANCASEVSLLSESKRIPLPAETQEICGGTSFFQDQVGFNELQDALLKIARARNCDLADVYFCDSDNSYAGVSYSGAVGTLFGSSHMGVSAILVPRKAVAR